MEQERLTGDLDPAQYNSILDVLERVFTKYGNKPGFSCFGKTLSYAEVDRLSNKFAQFLITKTDLQVGDRIAVQLPNVLQFPIVVYGAIKAGLIVVNTNPLYTKREMLHQFKDSGARAVVILSNFCDKLEEVLPETDISHVIVSQPGDLQSGLKRPFMNLGAKYLKRMIPEYSLPMAVAFHDIVNDMPANKVDVKVKGGDEVALILYTGATTGVAKGVKLSHNNLIANMMQLRSRCVEIIRDGQDTIIAPLPLYHSYAFLFHCLVMPYSGNHNLLITNPRDLDALIATMSKTKFQGFVGINTLFQALIRHPNIHRVDFREMRFSGAGGMAMTVSVATQWARMTNCEIFEGYGLTECSPVVSVNLPGRVKLGTVGLPVPDTEVNVMDDDGNLVSPGHKGELWVRGPQVMLGYWENDEETHKYLTDDGWFKTGDCGSIDSAGYLRILDRKRDMILISGFNVYPAEIEEVVNGHPGVEECAAIGVPDERSGESIRLFVVRSDNTLIVKDIQHWCRERLTAYKVPKDIVFAHVLPKSNVGKILRRKLKDGDYTE